MISPLDALCVHGRFNDNQPTPEIYFSCKKRPQATPQTDHRGTWKDPRCHSREGISVAFRPPPRSTLYAGLCLLRLETLSTALETDLAIGTRKPGGKDDSEFPVFGPLVLFLHHQQDPHHGQYQSNVIRLECDEQLFDRLMAFFLRNQPSATNGPTDQNNVGTSEQSEGCPLP